MVWVWNLMIFFFWVRLWKVCELHANEPLHVRCCLRWFSKKKKSNNNNGDVFVLLTFLSRCSEPVLTDTLHFLLSSHLFFFSFLSFFSFTFDLLKLYLYSTPLKITKCFKNFLNFLNKFLFILHLLCCSFLLLCVFFSLRHDLPSMATCILTSMRDLYSVTLHFPLSSWWQSDLGHVTSLTSAPTRPSDWQISFGSS